MMDTSSTALCFEYVTSHNGCQDTSISDEVNKLESVS